MVFLSVSFVGFIFVVSKSFSKVSSKIDFDVTRMPMCFFYKPKNFAIRNITQKSPDHSDVTYLYSLVNKLHQV